MNDNQDFDQINMYTKLVNMSDKPQPHMMSFILGLLIAEILSEDEKVFAVTFSRHPPLSMELYTGAMSHVRGQETHRKVGQSCYTFTIISQHCAILWFLLWLQLESVFKRQNFKTGIKHFKRLKFSGICTNAFTGVGDVFAEINTITTKWLVWKNPCGNCSALL